MALELVGNTVGLWRDPQWAPGMPGVYAVIVGVSAYPHLKGGHKPAPETHGLEQLVSSASTAAALFTWLRTSFRRSELPVVWCYLLLSPTPKELAELNANGLRHYAEPNYATLHKALQTWTGNVPKKAPASDQSRTLFFFSGHGVQSNWNALLLPSDYLDSEAGDPHLENCIGASELRKWMEESPVAEHLALIDACRNEFSPLASKGATAHGTFPLNPPGGIPPRTAATLASTSPNAVAYQLAGRPYTFFGQALLEALSGIAAAQDSHVEFRELVDYVKPRVNVLLQEAAGTALDQTVRPRIDGSDALVVTEIAAVMPAALEAMPDLLASARRPGLRSLEPRPRNALEAVHAAHAANAAVASRFDEALQVHDPIPLAALQNSFSEAQQRFGHEYASNVWLNGGVALHSLADASLIEDGAVVLAVERDSVSSIVQVDLALAPQKQGVLLVLQGGEHVQRERLAVALPTDTRGFLPIRLTLTIARSDPKARPKLQKLAARLGPCDWNVHYDYMWGLTREADLGSLRQAAAVADPNRLKRAVQDKINGQSAAVAGMLLLARAGAIGKVADWPRNLMRWFPEIPDGAVLWAESLRQALVRGESQPFGVTDPVDEMAAALQTLTERGLPFFADTLELAEGLVRHVLRETQSIARRKRLSEIGKWMERTFRVAMPSGHFIAMTGLPRPDWLGTDKSALSVSEMIDVLRHARST